MSYEYQLQKARDEGKRKGAIEELDWLYKRIVSKIALCPELAEVLCIIDERRLEKSELVGGKTQ